MDTNAIFAAAAVNRRAMADLLEGLTPVQLVTQSLCGEWDVQTVGAHLAAAITTKTPSFMLELLRNRGNFDRANSAVAIKEARHGITATIAKIRANADSRFAPPVVGPRAPLADVIIHTADIAQPLGLPYDAPGDHVRTVLEFLTGGRNLGFVKRGTLDGVRLVADDIDLGIGDGDEVRGRGIDLAMVLVGRSVVFDRLTGPGLSRLRSRFD